MLTPLIVLANSWKHHDYCIAGINPENGRWIRPVSDLADGRIRKNAMPLDGHFPQLMDVIEIPLADCGPDFGFERENRSIMPGKWRLAGRATVADVMPFAVAPRVVLHNDQRYVTLEDMQRKRFEDRATLELLHVGGFSVTKRMKVFEKNYWTGTIQTGARTIAARITDPVYHERLDAGHPPAPACLLTASLSMPFVPEGWRETKSPPCWKLIAGVIELTRAMQDACEGQRGPGSIAPRGEGDRGAVEKKPGPFREGNKPAFCVNRQATIDD